MRPDLYFKGSPVRELKLIRDLDKGGWWRRGMEGRWGGRRQDKGEDYLQMVLVLLGSVCVAAMFHCRGNDDNDDDNDDGDDDDLANV